MNNKDYTLTELENKTIFTAVKTLVETVTLDYQENPEGFRLFFDADSLEPLYGYYFYQTLQPYSYKEVRLTPVEFKQVIAWRESK